MGFAKNSTHPARLHLSSTLGINRITLTVGRSLPDYPDQGTLSDRPAGRFGAKTRHGPLFAKPRRRSRAMMPESSTRNPEEAVGRIVIRRLAARPERWCA